VQVTVIVTGAAGQLGSELLASVPPGVDCVALSRAQLDICDPRAVGDALARTGAAVLINAAAYTAVDRAEEEPALAARANRDGPAVLAAACGEHGCRMLHLSTDFVFDGESSHPYRPGDPTGPLGAYGAGKLAGEQAVLAALPAALVLRTGWVYSRFGGNFVKTMLRLMGQREQLAVVCDQVGTPTWAHGLARALWAAVERPGLCGIYHWSDAGVCSWYDFAVAIAEEAQPLGLLQRPVAVRPIPAADYPTPARRPAFSVLDKSASWRDLALEGVHWRVQLRRMLKELQERGDD
jgi:dTDP-4-dehydrorhamnose reductase